QLPFKLIYHVLDNKSLEMIYEDDKMFVNCFPLEHRIPTYGFFFKEKPRERNIKKEAIEDYNIPIKDIVKIKKGADYILPNDKVISNKEITLPPYQQRSYGFITDTLFNEGFAEHVENADLLYHEATFLHKDIDKAKNTFHSSALQAAILANRAKAKKLLIGHFSARYKNHQPFIDEARSSFEHSHGVNDGDVFDVELTRESE
ncbi:MAG: ribonuclease Z, partial [Cyclobacteriaceae bacterium]